MSEATASTGSKLEEHAKRAVGRYAVDTYVSPRTCIGLGTGSTAVYAIERVGELVANGLAISVVPTSLATEMLCRSYAIPIVPFGTLPIDVAIDGADEVAPDWSLIKGGGGAMFREKAVAIAARTFVVIVTERKLVAKLGAFALPIEVVPFSAAYVQAEIEAMGAIATPRVRHGEPVPSDNGNTILDCDFGAIDRPRELDAVLRALHGVVCTGLFTGLTSNVLVARDDGTVGEFARRSE